MPLPEGEIWRPMWLFHVMLLAFTNARQAGGLPDLRGSRLGRRRGQRSPPASPGHLLPLLRTHTLIVPAGYVASRLLQFETRTRQREGFVQDSVYSEAARVIGRGDDELDDGLDQDRR